MFNYTQSLGLNRQTSELNVIISNMIFLKSGEIFGRGQMFTAVSLDLAEPGMAWQEVTGSFKKFIFLVFLK